MYMCERGTIFKLKVQEKVTFLFYKKWYMKGLGGSSTHF